MGFPHGLGILFGRGEVKGKHFGFDLNCLNMARDFRKGLEFDTYERRQKGV